MRILTLILGASITCWAGSGPVCARESQMSLAVLDVTMWSPDKPSLDAHPVIIFSHGFHGCATQSRFVMEALAAADYVVFAPNHRDATCGGGKGSWRDKPQAPFRSAETWTDQTYRDRGDDIRQLLAALQFDGIRKAEIRRDRLDLSRIGLVGHSLGGYTVLGLAGAWPSWKLDGVKAVLALSPYTQPFTLQNTLKGLAAPVMYQGGTRDFGVTPTLHKSQGGYDQSPAPKYYVEFEGAGHFAWTDLREDAHAAILAYSLAFLDHYLKDAPADPQLTKPSSNVALLRYESELGAGGTADAAGPRRHPVLDRLRQRQAQ
jgi:predicted dienelactone hydrolase